MHPTGLNGYQALASLQDILNFSSSFRSSPTWTLQNRHFQTWVWERYCEQVGETRKVEKIPVEELDWILGHFFQDIKKQDGQECEPDSLTFHRSSIDIWSKKEPLSTSYLTEHLPCSVKPLPLKGNSCVQWAKERSQMPQNPSPQK